MEDIHKQTAAELFGIDENEVTPTQRRIGKKNKLLWIIWNKI